MVTRVAVVTASMMTALKRLMTALKRPACRVLRQRVHLLWTGSQSQTCSDGSWATAETRGGGEAEAEQVKESDHGGNFGLLTANWGGNWQEPKLQEHMLRDLKSTPCHLLCLQEAEDEMFTHLRTAVESDAVAERRPGSMFIGVRGPEP